MTLRGKSKFPTDEASGKRDVIFAAQSGARRPFVKPSGRLRHVAVTVCVARRCAHAAPRASATTPSLVHHFARSRHNAQQTGFGVMSLRISPQAPFHALRSLVPP
jgi:hypothetical protein